LSNNVEKYKFGNIYFFKNGNIEERDLTILDSSIRKLKLITNYDIKLDILSDEEMSNSIDNLETRTSQIEDVYRSLIDDGYSIVRMAKELIFYGKNIDFATYKTDVIIAEIVTPQDRVKIEEVINEHINNINKEKFHLNNLESFYHGKYYEYYHSNFTTINILNIMDLFLRDKSKELNVDDRILLNTYRTFNLENTLLKNNSEVTINNRNNACIVITPTEIFKQPLKSKDLREEIIKVNKSINPKLLLENKSMNGIVISSRSIIIELKYYEVIINIPGTIDDLFLNNYQITQMKIILKQIKELIDRDKKFMKPSIKFYALHIFGETFNDKKLVSDNIDSLISILDKRD